MDYLEEARRCIKRVQKTKNNTAEDQIDAQLAIACALVALTERLDVLTDFRGGKALFVTLTK